MIACFVIDPSLVREAVLEGRTLLVEVFSDKHYRVTLAGPSSYPPKAASMAKRA